MSRFIRFISILLLSSGVFAFAAWGTRSLLSSKPRVMLQPGEGFDFKLILDQNSNNIGPKVGERIDLIKLISSEGKTMASIAGIQPIMIVPISSSCAMCKIAADQMRDVRERVQQLGVQFFPVLLTPSKQPLSFFSYAASLNIDSRAFIWSPEYSPPPESLIKIIVPSHLLLDHTGIVLGKWPGGHKEEAVRKRMANQIVADTAEILSSKKIGANF